MECITKVTLVEMANKKRLNVLYLQNNNSDTTLFFIHGSMGTLTQFSDLIVSYQGRVNIVAYDTIGCGDSDKPVTPKDYSTESLTANAIEIFDKYSTAKNILIGHSYGTAQVARLCKHIHTRQTTLPPPTTTSTDTTKPLVSINIKEKVISGVVLLGTVDFLPAGGSPAFVIFGLPLCCLKPLQSWMSNAYVDAAFCTKTDKKMKDRALITAGMVNHFKCIISYGCFVLNCMCMVWYDSIVYVSVL